jgi:hypothetical protein
MFCFYTRHTSLLINLETFVENGFTLIIEYKHYSQNKMNNTQSFPASSIDVSKIAFVIGQAKSGRNPSVYMKYGNQNLEVLVPRMSFPGGVIVRDQETGGTSYTLIGSMKGCDPYAKVRASGEDEMGSFYNFLLDLEQKIIDTAVENSVKWFGKKRTEVGLREGWKSMINVSSDKVGGEYVPNGKYPPSFKVKVPVYDGRVSTEVVDAKLNPVYVKPDNLASVFPKGVDASMTVTASIYIMAGGGFGVTWRLGFAQVIPRLRRTAANVFSVVADEAEEEPVAGYGHTMGGGPIPEDEAEETERPVTPDDQPSVPLAPTAPQRKRRVAQ